MVPPALPERPGGDEKTDAERHIFALCWQRIRTGGAEAVEPSYLEFRAWCEAQGYGQYFDFRSLAGPEHDAERWFADLIRQISPREDAGQTV